MQHLDYRQVREALKYTDEDPGFRYQKVTDEEGHIILTATKHQGYAYAEVSRHVQTIKDIALCDIKACGQYFPIMSIVEVRAETWARHHATYINTTDYDKGQMHMRQLNTIHAKNYT